MIENHKSLAVAQVRDLQQSVNNLLKQKAADQKEKELDIEIAIVIDNIVRQKVMDAIKADCSCCFINARDLKRDGGNFPSQVLAEKIIDLCNRQLEPCGAENPWHLTAAWEDHDFPTDIVIKWSK